jgi:hypothetical protein
MSRDKKVKRNKKSTLTGVSLLKSIYKIKPISTKLVVSGLNDLFDDTEISISLSGDAFGLRQGYLVYRIS